MLVTLLNHTLIIPSVLKQQIQEPKVTGNLEVTGVLTYEDVTNIDSVGIVTAREGLIPDNKELKIGNTATSDLRIYSNGTESFVDSYGGNFYIRLPISLVT